MPICVDHLEGGAVDRLGSDASGHPVSMASSTYRSVWARSGAMHLTGRASRRPLVAPDETVAAMVDLGATLGLDALAHLGERASIIGLSRRGAISCGGAARLLRTGDGWVVVSLPRDEDVSTVPAWLEVANVDLADPWDVVEGAVTSQPAARLVERGRLLGLAVGEVPLKSIDRAGRGSSIFDGLPVVAERLARGGTSSSRSSPLIVDLSSLWAGPLCARLLGEQGGVVIKVESLHRPDGARSGPQPFFDLMHAGHRSVALDLTSDEGKQQLAALLARADVVIEASRPRALAQLGMDRRAITAERPKVWLAITGHGSVGPGADRIGFGDDAGAAGGLVAWDGSGPCFVADAVADPLSGVVAAAAAVAALDAGGGWLIDVSMAAVARHVAPPPQQQWLEGDPAEALPPTAPKPSGRAPEFGEHTGEVMREFGLT